MTSFSPTLLFCFAFGLQLYDVSSWNFAPVSEPFAATTHSDNSTTVTFMCQADTPLVKCQFNAILITEDDHFEPIDLSKGSNSGLIARKDPNDNITIFEVSYNGTGLEHGQCGATFKEMHVMAYRFGCRGADATETWKDMDFIISDHLPDPEVLVTTINPRQVVAMPGSDVSILLKTNATIGRCMILFEGRDDPPLRFYGDGKFKTFTAKYRYYGSSPSEGECGITLLNVTETDNGPMSHVAWTSNGGFAHRVATLIVASPPTETYFRVDKLKYSVGDTLTATCSSLLSRPVANLTWTLDDRIIRQDGTDDEFQEDVWSWPWDKKNITQRLILSLEEEHFGKTLECHITHLEMTESQAQLHNIIKNKMSIAQTTLWVICVVCFVFVVVLLTVVVYKLLKRTLLIRATVNDINEVTINVRD